MSDLDAIAQLAAASGTMPPLPVETLLDEQNAGSRPGSDARCTEAAPSPHPSPHPPPAPPSAGPRSFTPSPRKPKPPPRTSSLTFRLLRVGLLLQRYRAASSIDLNRATVTSTSTASQYGPQEPGGGGGAAAAAAVPAAAAAPPPPPTSSPCIRATSRSLPTPVLAVSIGGSISLELAATEVLPSPTDSTGWGTTSPDGYSRWSLSAAPLSSSEGALSLASPPPRPPSHRKLPQCHPRQPQQRSGGVVGRVTATAIEAGTARAGVGVVVGGGCAICPASSVLGAGQLQPGSGGGGSAQPLAAVAAAAACDACGGGGGSGEQHLYGGQHVYDTAVGAQQVLQWLRAIGARPGCRLTVQMAEWCDSGSLQHRLQLPQRSSVLGRASAGSFYRPCPGAGSTGGSGAGAGAGCSCTSLEPAARGQYGTFQGCTALAGNGSPPSSATQSRLEGDAALWITHPAPAATVAVAVAAPSGPGSGPLSGSRQRRAGTATTAAAGAAPAVQPLSLLPLLPMGGGQVPGSLVRWAGRIAALRCSLQVAQALAHLHASGFYHSNLNPTSIGCCRVPAPAAGTGSSTAGAVAAPPPKPTSTAALLEQLIASTPLGQITCKLTALDVAPMTAAAAVVPPVSPTSTAEVTALAPSGGAAAATDGPQPAGTFACLKAAAEAVAATAAAPPGGGAAVSKPSLELSLNTAQWGAIAYVAPELVMPPTEEDVQTSDFSGAAAASAVAVADFGGAAAANAFSFGMILWQLLTCRTPHYELHPAQILVGRATGDLDLSLEWPEDTDEELRRLGEGCLDRDPVRRPSLAVAAAVLERVLERETADCREVLALHVHC
ncbi:hypothetical protein PLESTF_001170400 [Pleodorina starrii]|nr:hypothetical protein PLESTF_001170400 [Pleodorina starrii]